MKNKEIVGTILIVGSVTALSYLYSRYYRYYKELDKTKNKKQ